MKTKQKCALILLLAAMLLSGCGVREVDISNTHPAAEPSAAPAVTPAATPAITPGVTPAPTPGHEPGEMVRIVDIIPSIYTDARYASADNITGEAIYDTSEIYLRYSTAEKLARVQDRLNEQGYSLCVWDGWRPVAAQFALWRAVPDARYVSNPFTGLSGHCRGNTVDITLVALGGEPVDMPTGFDDFSALADRDYSDVSVEAAANARLLEDAMTAEGFKPYFAEWWHYTDEDEYEVCEALTEPETLDIERDTQMYADTNYITTVCGMALAGERVRVLDRVDGYLLIHGGAGYGYIRDQVE